MLLPAPPWVCVLCHLPHRGIAVGWVLLSHCGSQPRTQSACGKQPLPIPCPSSLGSLPAFLAGPPAWSSFSLEVIAFGATTTSPNTCVVAACRATSHPSSTSCSLLAGKPPRAGLVEAPASHSKAPRLGLGKKPTQGKKKTPSLALTGAGLGPVDLQQEDDDGQQVGDVPQDAEDVHGGSGPFGAGGRGRP